MKNTRPYFTHTQPNIAESEYTYGTRGVKKLAADSRLETNVLLVKDDVGAAKPFTRPLPKHGAFMYGDSVQHDKEHAPAVTNNWEYSIRSSIGTLDKDFKKLNKAATYNQATTAPA